MASRWDAAGRWYFNWDAENRLVRVVKPGWRPLSYRTITYSYDALGRRIERQSKSAGTENYTYDGQDVILDQNSSGGQTTYINGPGIDNKLKMTSGGIASYFTQDHLGSTTALTDSNGTVISSATYDGFGRQTGTLATRFGYTGRELDPDTGLMYYRARWYDPIMGRFISEDPIGFKGGINFYAYTENDPLSYTDPTGLRPCAQILKEIWETLNILKSRASDLVKDPQNLQWSHWDLANPHPRFGSVEGHRVQYEGWRNRLNNLLEEWKDCWKGGGPRPPGECWEWAKTPAPWPIRRPNPALPSQSEYDSNAEAARQRYIFWQKITFGGYLVGGVLTGGALFGGTAAAGSSWALLPIFGL